jgi:charged multivesicular body protein 2A
MDDVYNKIFGDPPTPKQLIRTCQRELARDCRDLDRQRKKMEVQEKVNLLEAKAEAKKGNVRAAKAKAKLVARTRTMIDRYCELQVNLEGISQQIGMMGAVASMQKAMKGAVKAMYRMNNLVGVPMMQRILREFDKQQNLMEMKDELMGDALDDALGGDEIEEQENLVYQQILDELSLVDDAKMPSMPSLGEQLPNFSAVSNGEPEAKNKK